MARKSVADCTKGIKSLVRNKQMTDVQADELVLRINNLAKDRAVKTKMKLDDALKQIEGEIVNSLKFEAKVNERNRLLTINAKREVKAAINKFDKLGEGIQALLEGGNVSTPGARLSVDYKARSMYNQYFGSFIAEIEQLGIMREFRSGKLDREIYQEIAELNKKGGTPGVSKNDSALKIATAYNRVRKEMVSRQNRAGAYIRDLDGYIMRQSHDTGEIQKLGKDKNGKPSKAESFKKWYQLVLPLLDHQATFRGLPPKDFMEKVHESLYTGVHGAPSDEAEIAEFFAHGSMARSASSHRVLHFKDANASFEYNQMFGAKNFSDGLLNDMLFRSRNITMMETFGPNPKQTFKEIVNDIRKEARTREDAAEQVKRIDDWRVNAAWSEVSGENEYPANITLDKISSSIRIVTQLSKMGGVVLSSMGDKAFLQSEMAFQGVSQLETFGKNITGMFARSPEQKEILHQMGIGLDSMIGNTISRYTIHSQGMGKLNKIQQKFYDLNFMNWWNDVHKSTAGELMANNLGRNSSKSFKDLDPDLSRTLSLYDIGEVEWEALRKSTVKAPNGEFYVTPSSIKSLPLNVVDNLVNAKGLKVTPQARTRVLDQLDQKLRTYFTDRIDMAVPTPGAAERKYLTFGTQAGTPLGESLRMLSMFKSFPVTVLRKIVGREVYGRGSNTISDWLMNDHKGKFALAQLIAMTTIGGYLSGVIKDTVKGRTPKPLVKDDSINWDTVNDAFLRGGGAGILGDFLFTEYDQNFNTFTGAMAGPVFGQLDPITSGFAKAIRGEDPTKDISRIVTNNTPFINLFYIRPVIDYFILWNMQEMMSEGFVDRMAESVEEQGQEFIIDPRDAIK